MNQQGPNDVSKLEDFSNLAIADKLSDGEKIEIVVKFHWILYVNVFSPILILSLCSFFYQIFFGIYENLSWWWKIIVWLSVCGGAIGGCGYLMKFVVTSALENKKQIIMRALVPLGVRYYHCLLLFRGMACICSVFDICIVRSSGIKNFGNGSYK